MTAPDECAFCFDLHVCRSCGGDARLDGIRWELDDAIDLLAGMVRRQVAAQAEDEGCEPAVQIAGLIGDGQRVISIFDTTDGQWAYRVVVDDDATPLEALIALLQHLPGNYFSSTYMSVEMVWGSADPPERHVIHPAPGVGR